MKTALVVCGCLLASPPSWAFVGNIIFNNRVPPLVDAPISLPDGSGVGAAGKAQLVLVNSDGSLLPLGPIAPFRNSSPEARYYVQPPADAIPIRVDVDVDCAEEYGAPVTLRLRAWLGDDWDSAPLRAESKDFTVLVFPMCFPAANLDGLEGFSLRPQIIMSSAVSDDHEVQLLADCPTVDRVILQSSLDFVNWTNITTNIVVDGTAKFSVAPESGVNYFRGLSAKSSGQ